MAAIPETSDQSSNLSRLLVICLYVLFCLCGIVEAACPWFYFVFALAIAYTATLWAVIDARRAGRPLLHIIQLLMFFTWSIALPIYLIWSRGWRGLVLVFLHAAVLSLVFCASFYATFFVFYGPDAFRF